jgi:hypothetical protein
VSHTKQTISRKIPHTQRSASRGRKWTGKKEERHPRPSPHRDTERLGAGTHPLSAIRGWGRAAALCCSPTSSPRVVLATRVWLAPTFPHADLGIPRSLPRRTILADPNSLTVGDLPFSSRVHFLRVGSYGGCLKRQRFCVGKTEQRRRQGDKGDSFARRSSSKQKKEMARLGSDGKTDIPSLPPPRILISRPIGRNLAFFPCAELRTRSQVPGIAPTRGRERGTGRGKPSGPHFRIEQSVRAA